MLTSLEFARERLLNTPSSDGRGKVGLCIDVRQAPPQESGGTLCEAVELLIRVHDRSQEKPGWPPDPNWYWTGEEVWSVPTAITCFPVTT